ncbi:UNVERIFIED_ORG: iron complex outermembrane receptor protein [Shinella zoogloeoides]|nr:iron complex outermembrane receptor protein [Shinella zoogloeoides]
MEKRSGVLGQVGISVSSVLALILGAGIPAAAVMTAKPAIAQDAARDISIPASPLSRALNQLASQSGIHIGFESATVAGKTTPGLTGRYTAPDALAALLSGTGLYYDFSNSHTATVLASSPQTASAVGSDAGGSTLEAIIVDGGSGGVINADGYVGKSSATGAKTDTPFVETPQSISSVTEKQMVDRNPKSLLDAIAYTPGARVSAYGTDPRFDSFFVRGFNLTNTGVFRDNLRQPVAGYGYFLTEPYGIEGISILRGPSSALYGATGAGGLYNVITKRPTEETLREAAVQWGTDQRYQGQFDLSGAFNDNDALFYRLTGVARAADTEFSSVSDDKLYLAPGLTWKPEEGTRLTLLGEYSRSQTGGNPGYYNDAYGHVSPFQADDPAFSDLDHKQGRFGWEFEHAFDETFTFRQNARYSKQDIDSKYVYTYNGVAHAADPTLIDRGTGYELQTLDAFVIDNQLEAKFDTGAVEHTLLGGVDFTWAKFSSTTGYGAASPLNTLVPNYGDIIATPDLTSRSDQKQLHAGLYMQDQLRYDAWTLTLGGRYDWVSTSTTTTDLASGTSTSMKQTDGEFSGRVGLTYETPFGIVPYASLSTAFSPNIGISAVTGSPFKATTSTQQEVGVKYLLPDDNAMITSSLFNIDQDNGLFYEVINGINTQVQRGKLRSRGVELEAVASLDDGLSLAASYTYTDLRIREGNAATKGNFVSSVPFNMASLWVHYAMPEDTPLHGLGLGAGVRFIGSSYGDDTNTLINGARALVDASVSFDFKAINPEFDGLSLQVNATNLFNRRDTTCTGGYCYLDTGRSVLGTLRYTW